MFWHSLVCFLDVPTFTSLSRAVKMSCPNFEHNDQIDFNKTCSLIIFFHLKNYLVLLTLILQYLFFFYKND